MDNSEKDLRNELARRMNLYNPDITNNPVITGFIFTLINKRDKDLASLFIDIYDIKHLYEKDTKECTPLMLAVLENTPDIVKAILVKTKKNICDHYKNRVSELRINQLNLFFDELNITDDAKITPTNPDAMIARYNRIIRILEEGNGIQYKLVAKEEKYIEDIMELTGFNKSLKDLEGKNTGIQSISSGSELKNGCLVLLETFPPVGKCTNNILRKQKTPSRISVKIKNRPPRVPVKMQTPDPVNRTMKELANAKSKRAEIKQLRRVTPKPKVDEDVSDLFENFGFGDSGNMRKSPRKSRRKSPRKSPRKSRRKSRRKSPRKSPRKSRRKSPGKSTRKSRR
jgi:hypothetical protein